jgi:hypothetical protein
MRDVLVNQNSGHGIVTPCVVGTRCVLNRVKLLTTNPRTTRYDNTVWGLDTKKVGRVHYRWKTQELDCMRRRVWALDGLCKLCASSVQCETC